MKLADKIILLRKQKGWSQEELAAQMDVSRQSVSKWESDASVPDIDKIIMLSRIFGTTTDFLLRDDEEISEEQSKAAVNSDVKEIPRRHVTGQEAEEFIETRKMAGKNIGIGVFLCIISPAILIALSGMSQVKEYRLSEKMAVAVGLSALFVLVTIAVCIFIINGMKLGKYEFLEKELIIMDPTTSDKVKQESEAYMPVFSKNIAIGVVLCIVSVIPLVAFAIMENELMTVICVSVLLLIVACGVFLIVNASMIKGSYDRLLQKEDFTLKKKQAKEKLDPIASVYWMVVTIIYLLISFLTNRWDITWLIWVVSGIMFGIITVIIENRQEKE